MVVKANFYSEQDLAVRARAGGLAKQEAPALPRYLTCGYEDFLRLLVRRHGEGYLLRPDGEALAYVPAAAFVLPVEKPRRQPAPLPPPPLPVSPALAENSLQTRGRNGVSITRNRIVAALVTPMTTQEIALATGLSRRAVQFCLWKNRVTFFRSLPQNRWEVVNHEMG